MKVNNGVWLALLASGLLTGCSQKLPPAQRPQVTLPVLAGNIAEGKQAFNADCSQCHQIISGHNSKGPQLDRIYGAPAAALADYQARYSDGLKKSHLIWDAATLDRYIARPKSVIPDTKMLSDDVNNPQERQAIIAYLSTLRGSDLPKTIP